MAGPESGVARQGEGGLRDVDGIGTRVDGARRMTALVTSVASGVSQGARGPKICAGRHQAATSLTITKGSLLLLHRLVTLPAVLLLAVAGLAPAATTFADSTLQAGQTVVIVGTDGRGLRLRAGPGVSHRILTTLQEGLTVQVVSGPVSDGDDDWYQLSYTSARGDVTTGWGVSSYLLATAAVRSLSVDDGGSRVFLGKVTAYADGLGGVPVGAKTYSGTKTRWGVVAVDPKVIPIGSLIQIEGYDGIFVAEDVGSAIKGEAVDIWLPDTSAAKTYGTQYRKITVLREGPDRGDGTTAPSAAPSMPSAPTGIPSAPTLIP